MEGLEGRAERGVGWSDHLADGGGGWGGRGGVWESWREWLREGRGGGRGVGGEGLRQLDRALYAGRQEGDPGRAWSWYRWSNLEQNLHYLVISAISSKKLNF